MTDNILFRQVREFYGDQVCSKKARMDECNILALYSSEFEDKYTDKEFLNLDEMHFIIVISDDKLNVKDEEKVFDVTMKWFSHNNKVQEEEEGEKIKLSSLISNIRFPLMKPERVRAILKNPLILQSQKCLSIIDEALEFFFDGTIPTLNTIKRTKRFKPRNPIRGGLNIYYLSRAIADRTPHHLLMYNPVDDCWRRIEYKSSRDWAGYTIHDGSLYIVGGGTELDDYATVDRFHIESEKWFNEDDVPTLKHRRAMVSVVGLDEYVYIIGGERCRKPLNYVERYDIFAKVWEDCAPMKEKRIFSGVAALDGSIFVFGGRGKNSAYLSSGERYDPKTDTWTDISNMRQGRMNIGCIVHQGKIYALGGVGECHGNLVEVYDPVLDRWNLLPSPMSCNFSLSKYMGMIGFGDKLFMVMSNTTRSNPIPTEKLLLEYDVKKKIWSKKETSIVSEMMAGVLNDISWPS